MRLLLCMLGMASVPALVAEPLEALRARHRVPALAGAATLRGEVVEIAAAGVRRVDQALPVTTEDRWHIGSLTKSMTASIAAMLVEEGLIAWETDAVAALPAMRATMHAGWREVTLEHLLLHRGGAPAKPPDSLWELAWLQTGTVAEQRRAFVEGLLRTAPETHVGVRFQYSNEGYTIAGHMLEAAAGKPWETLVRERLWEPLGMRGAGFGAPGAEMPGSEPLGHQHIAGKLEPMPATSAGSDNPPAIGPAGTVHCTLRDLALYASWHARRGAGGNVPALLKPESFARMHRQVGASTYALGWDVIQREWAGGAALTHAGTNTMWFAVIWVAPERDAAFVAVTNCAHGEADAACDEVVAGMVRRVLPR